MLRPGLAVTNIAVTEVPARPTAVWTVKKSHEDAYDDLIVISFSDDKATLVLRVGDTVQEVNDSGLEGKTATIGMQLMGNNSVLQVHQGGLRHINVDRRINKWAPPGRRALVSSALNKEQVRCPYSVVLQSSAEPVLPPPVALSDAGRVCSS